MSPHDNFYKFYFPRYYSRFFTALGLLVSLISVIMLIKLSFSGAYGHLLMPPLAALVLGVFLTSFSHSFKIGWQINLPANQLLRFISLFGRERFLNQIDCSNAIELQVHRSRQSSGKNSSTIYPISLVQSTHNSEKNITLLAKPFRYYEARLLAEFLAKHLCVALSDYSSGAAIRRTHEEINKPLRERLVNNPTRLESARPVKYSVQVSSHGSQREFLIPAAVSNVQFMVILSLLLCYFFLLYFLIQVEYFDLFAVLAILPLPLLIFTIIYIFKKCLGETIRLDANQIQTAKLLFGLKISKNMMPLSELEELHIISSTQEPALLDQDGQKIEPSAPLPRKLVFFNWQYLMLRSDKKDIEFANSLDLEQLAYLKWQIEQAVLES